MPLRITAAVLLIIVVALHAPVFTRGSLITPAGMHYAQWPWKAYAAGTLARGAMLEGNHTLSDLLFQVYPWQLFTARSLESGSVPLWNPYSYCGVPFVANAQSAIFYPLHWPSWIFPSMRVFTAALLMKILLAGIFMAIFLKGLGCGPAACVVGSVSFALCGFMTSWLGYAHTNAALFLPLLMHAARALAFSPATAPFLLLAFAAAAQFLGGHPETSLHIMAAALLFFLWNLRESKRPRLAAALFTGAGLLGFMLAAVQLFPFIEYLKKSAALRQRQALPGMDPSLPADALWGLVLPNHFGRPPEFSYHGPAPYQALAVYAGVGVLLLALMSLGRQKGARFFQVLALLSGLIVYGPPEVRSVIRLIPALGIASNNRLLLLLSFSLAVLAALVLQQTAAAPTPSGGKERLRALGPLALWTILLALAILSQSSTDRQDAPLAAAAVAGTALLLALVLLRPSRGSIYVMGVAAISCVDMFAFAYRFNPHADPGALFPPTRLTDFLRQDPASDMARGGRMMTIGWTMRPETQMVYRLSSIEGYDAMEYDCYRRLLDQAGVAAIHQTGEVPENSRRLLNLMALRYLVTPPGGVVSGDELTMAYDGPDGRVFINDQARPRFGFVDRAAPMTDDPLDALASGRVDPAREVLLEGRRSTTAGGEDAATSVRPSITLEKNAPGSLAVSVRGHGRPGYLVIADTHGAGWEARIDGRPVQVLQANGCFMAVGLPSQDVEVSLLYRPASFRAGAWVSLLSLLFALALGLVSLGSLKT